MEKRDQLIDQLEKRLAQRTTSETLFTIRLAGGVKALQERGLRPRLQITQSSE